MNILYDRRETADQIEFEFHFLPLANLLFLLAIAAPLAPRGILTHKAERLCGILLILWIFKLLPAWIEIEKAMRHGSVSVSGSKISFNHPLKLVIPKPQPEAPASSLP